MLGEVGGRVTANEYGVSFGGMVVLETRSGNGCTTL